MASKASKNPNMAPKPPEPIILPEEEAEYKVGDYVQSFYRGLALVGIVYEVHHYGGSRIQLADGQKVRDIDAEQFAPATPEQVAAYEASHAEGMTPAAIIEREDAELASGYGKGSASDPTTDDNSDDNGEEDE